MSTYRTRDGRTLKWGGLNACVCSQCEQLFNSVAAFDAHIKRATVKDGKRTDHEPIHDHSWMPRNSAGRLVTSLREPDDGL